MAKMKPCQACNGKLKTQKTKDGYWYVGCLSCFRVGQYYVEHQPKKVNTLKIRNKP